MIPQWFHVALLFALVGVTLWRGGSEARFAGIYCLATYPLNGVLLICVHGSEGVRAATSVLDVLVFTLMALRSQRYWTLAAAAVSWVEVSTDLIQIALPVSGWAIGTARLVWFYALVAVVATGSFRTRRRVPGASLGAMRLEPAWTLAGIALGLVSFAMYFAESSLRPWTVGEAQIAGYYTLNLVVLVGWLLTSPGLAAAGARADGTPGRPRAFQDKRASP